ncbi:DNA polymerase I [Lacticaseibacillus saniviri]|uniref:DNA polymerase I n=1 Tax=Lacticaseibacillus saniviri JCM 17471 = DSM 24301 TaxID=1293598 RepID=A0A0R2MSX7_9LACO|nr:DNA polymerase I [Lacticaseibacillus saniviri]KRO16664.1 DNA-directed DNA polymerase [Lacticaseibacillus saniviri JCM 17471 = DSM 24301]
MAKAKKLLLIDGNSVAFRAFFAMYSQLDRFVTSAGVHTNAVYAFNNMLEVLLKNEQPDAVLVAFDAGSTTFRTKEFSTYKDGRAKTPSELIEQLPYIKQILEARGIKHYELKDYEADDIIGTMSRQAQAAGWESIIVTGDRDLTQLTTPHVTVDVTVKGVNELEVYTPEHVKEKLGITPDQIIDLKGLMGDTSDNYPGVTKVGEKTALKLLNQFGTIDNLYANIDDLKASKMKENLINDKEQALMSRKLATIITDAPITIGLQDVIDQPDDEDRLREIYTELEMKTALAKLGGAAPVVDTKPAKYTVLDDKTILALTKITTPVAFELEMLDDNYHTSDIFAFFIGTEDETFVSTDVTLLTIPEVKTWLEKAPLSVFDSKRNIVAANRLDITLQNIDFDVLLASYLLNPDENSNDLGRVAMDHDYQLQTDEDVYGKGAKRQIPADDVLFAHLAHKAQALIGLRPHLTSDLADQDQSELFTAMEMPLAQVLARMEITGIQLDQTTLKQMGGEFEQSLKILEEKAYAQAGMPFNLNSPKQLGEVLFEKLGLPVVKKTKTGYSTSVDVLEELKSSHDIIQTILDYRTINKIQSTYVTGLLKAVQPDGKIHTRYLQTLTQTGRLSSVDPNMQNIPARDEGKQIRYAFVPSEPDWQIFSSDYSQIELRVLAHISGDPNMQEAFKEDRDIHANTAMKIFNLDSPDQVTPDMRRQAKATNFGIVYGISDFGLARNIGITRSQAKAFIEGYFEQYPLVRQYMDDMVKQAREKGYVETLFHRRRYLPQIHSRNFNLRSFAERTAMNTPIQGSAADIIKVAMIRMNDRLAKEGLKARMLLQVHDELIFEAPTAEIATLEDIVPSVMDSAVDLAIPLKVESHYGKTWFDAK